MSHDFSQRVYHVVARIPYGRVTTYGRIARALGAPRSARMVGWALRRIHPGLRIPAHRVVNRAGVLSGAIHFAHPDLMRQLLEAEGVLFLPDDRVDLPAVLWDPADDPELDHLCMIPD